RCRARNLLAGCRGGARLHRNRARVLPRAARRSTTPGDETRTAFRPACEMRPSDYRDTECAATHAPVRLQTARARDDDPDLPVTEVWDERFRRRRAPASRLMNKPAGCFAMATSSRDAQRGGFDASAGTSGTRRST